MPISMNAQRIALALLVGLVAVPFAVLAAAPDLTAYNGFDVSAATVPLSAIERGGPPKDGIPAIDQPKFVTASQASLQPDDRVLALNRNGVARAYPVRILNWHEVVNDRVGAEAIVVTYCPLCGTGMAFEARVRGRPTTFGVSGLLYNSDVLLYDRATQSLWSQIKQAAVAGPMHGTRLVSVPLEHTTWADWRARNPGTQVLSTATGFVRDYDRDPYSGYHKIERLMFDVQHRDDRFPLKEWVLGLDIDGVQKAYPFSVLDRAAGNSGGINDSVGKRVVRIHFDRSHRTARAFDGKGQPLPAVMAFWFAWVAFHPATEVFRAQ
jgi:hypothetical protein